MGEPESLKNLVEEGEKGGHGIPPRVLGLLPVVAITYFCVSGGAYGIEIEVASAPPFYVLLLNFLIPWLWGFPLALVTAELSCSMPEEGGCVVWGNRAYGRFYGWLVGFMSFCSGIVDTTLYPVLFASYMCDSFGIKLTHFETWGVQVLVVIAIALVNVWGADLVGVASYIFGIMVLLPTIIVCILGARDFDIHHLAETSGVPFSWPPLLSTILWCSSGWDGVGQLAGEIKNPEKNFPRAMMITMALVIVVYIVPLAIGMSVDQIYTNWDTGYFSVIATKVGGQWLSILLGIGGMMSSLGLFNCLLCANARLLHCMASKKYVPKILAANTPKRETPIAAIIFNSVLIALLGYFSFDILVEMDFLLYSLTIMLEYAAWMKLRVAEPEMERPYRLPFSKGKRRIISGIFLILPPFSLAAFNFFMANWSAQVMAVGMVLLGVALYFIAVGILKLMAKRKTRSYGVLHNREFSIQQEGLLSDYQSVVDETPN